MVEVDILRPSERRRVWSAEEKASLQAEVDAEGGKVRLVARRHGIGERKQQALVLALIQAALEPAPLGIAVSVSAHKESELVAALSALARGPVPDAMALAPLVNNKEIEKFDPFLGDDLLTLAWARDRIDAAGLPTLAAGLLACLAPA